MAFGDVLRTERGFRVCRGMRGKVASHRRGRDDGHVLAVEPPPEAEEMTATIRCMLRCILVFQVRPKEHETRQTFQAEWKGLGEEASIS